MELSRQQHSFRKGFVRLIGTNSEKKEAACRPPWLTDGIDGRRLCTLIFSVVKPGKKLPRGSNNLITLHADHEQMLERQTGGAADVPVSREGIQAPHPRTRLDPDEHSGDQ